MPSFKPLLKRFAPVLLTFAIMMSLSPAIAPSASAVSAMENLDIVGEQGFGADTSVDPQEDLILTVAYIIDSLLGLMGIVLVVIIIYAGFLWMTAGGSEEKVTKAKKWITNAVIGLVLVLAAYSIASFVVGAITDSANIGGAE